MIRLSEMRRVSQLEGHQRSDNRSGPLTVELITKCINELAQEVGVMEPDNPRWATVLEELFQLTQLRRAREIRNHACG